MIPDSKCSRGNIFARHNGRDTLSTFNALCVVSSVCMGIIVTAFPILTAIFFRIVNNILKAEAGMHIVVRNCFKWADQKSDSAAADTGKPADQPA